MASGAGQSAVVTSLLDHGADVHAGTGVGDYSTALCVVLLLHDNIIHMYVCRLSENIIPYIFHATII